MSRKISVWFWLFVLLLNAKCALGSTKIYSVKSLKETDSKGVLKHKDTLISVRGISQSYSVEYDEIGSVNYSIYDSTGSILVIYVFPSRINIAPYKGDSVFIRGTLKQAPFKTLHSRYVPDSGTAIIDADSVAIISKASGAFRSAIHIQHLTEQNESDFVELDSLIVVDPNSWNSKSLPRPRLVAFRKRGHYRTL